MKIIAKISGDSLEVLRDIGHFDHLSIAQDGSNIWINNIQKEQMSTPQFLALPDVSFFQIKETKIIPYGKILPIGRMPDHLDFKPIQEASPLKIEEWNHNYFGVKDSIPLYLKKNNAFKDPVALLAETTDYNIDTVLSAGSYRLNLLEFVLIDSSHFLIYGTPLLPLRGSHFWMRNNHFYPAGLELNHPNLEKSIIKALRSQRGPSFILWNADESYDIIGEELFSPLTRDSFRKSLHIMTDE